MTNKTIITCALTGSSTTLQQNPSLPCTPVQIAAAGIAAAKAGAAVLHIHVRHPDGRPARELEYYREAVKRIRDSSTDVVINLTTGPGGRFDPSEADPAIAGPGTTLMAPERRVEHILALRPEISTMDCNTMFMHSSVVINTPRNLRIMAKLIASVGTKPELECFDSGDIHLANDLIKEGLIEGTPLFQLVLGVKYGAAATPASLQYLSSLLPRGADWAAFGISRWEYPMLVQSWLLGGHVRVGLEDNVYIRKGVLAPDNAALVEKARRILEELDATIATPAEVREMLKLKKMDPAF
jgi:uncharacterized protein (DUF849 family)